MDRDLSKTLLNVLRGHDPVCMTTPTPILLLGGMGVGKSEILKRFREEQPFMLFATVRSMVAETPPDGETRSADPTDWIIDDIGMQFGLPDRSIVGTPKSCSSC